jgi:hypothetical protein
MNDLVVLLKNKPLVSTFLLFEKMGYKEHRVLKRVIADNMDAFNEIGLLHLQVQKPTDKKGGRPIESYLLDEDQFILLILLAKNTPESIQLKVRVAKEFRRLKAVVANIVSQQKDPNWQNIRSDGKIAYKQKTDAIKTFVDYATEQGSKSASMYYANLAKMENKALFFIEQKYDNLREILTIKQLMQACTADDVIEKALIDGMDKKLHYKEIYKLARDRIHAFAEIIGKSQVHLLTEAKEIK